MALLSHRPVLSGIDRLEVPALELPTTPGAVRNLLGVSFARFQIVEIHPLVCASYPPELSPDFVLSPARTTQRDHRLLQFQGGPELNDNFNSEEFMRDAQKDINTIAAVRDEFLKKPPSLPHTQDKNLIDEAPFFCEDIDFNSAEHTLIAKLEDPPKFIYKNNLAQLTISVSLPKGVTLENPDHVRNALLTLYTRIKYHHGTPST